jgi:hypothetical protein
MYSTDNGVHYNTWPDAGITPYRSEKNTNWEGGWRVPAFARWPGKIKACKRTFKVHIDGQNMLPYFTGKVAESPRKSFFYVSDDGEILAVRMADWKVVLMEQRAKTSQCWFEPFVKLRAPELFNLRRDPFERADENSNTYWDWVIPHAYIIHGMQALVADQIEAFRAFPPRQKPASFNLDAVMRQLEDSGGGANHQATPVQGGARRHVVIPDPALAGRVAGIAVAASVARFSTFLGAHS